jgi:hypothetical protein
MVFYYPATMGAACIKLDVPPVTAEYIRELTVIVPKTVTLKDSRIILVSPHSQRKYITR